MSVLDNAQISTPVPLVTDSDGMTRVKGTRVTLDTIAGCFNEGLTAEEIAQQYPSVRLADIYAVIAYYLANREKVEGYLSLRSSKAATVRRENEARFEPRGVRARLLARRRKA